MKDNLLKKIQEAKISEYPFFNLGISEAFPDDFYKLLKDRMLYYKYNKKLEKRTWDNAKFVNKKLSLKDIDDYEIKVVKELFEDSDIKKAFFEKFYLNYDFCNEVTMRHDLQFVFTDKDRFQTIHTDIPAQFISVNFYLPETELSQEEVISNGTVLYDKNLNPCKTFNYTENSLSCFAPHFYSYHGFDTNIDNRNTMLFFYAQKDLFQRFYADLDNKTGEQDVDKFKDIIQWKISKYRLIEYGQDDMDYLTKLLQEKSDCKINSLNGRIMV